MKEEITNNGIYEGKSFTDISTEEQKLSLNNVNLSKSTISGQLFGARFDFVSMVDCNLSNVHSAGSMFYYSNFACMQSNNGTWFNTDFRSSWMCKSNFSGSTITHCGFLGSDMSGSLFSDTTLENYTSFQLCNLPYANFSNSKLLQNIKFLYSNLCGANFTNINCKHKQSDILPKFTGSVVIGLEGLDLNNPCFNDAIKTPEELVSAINQMLSSSFEFKERVNALIPNTVAQYTYHQSLLYVIEQEKDTEKKAYYQTLSELFIQKFQETALLSAYAIAKQNEENSIYIKKTLIDGGNYEGKSFTDISTKKQKSSLTHVNFNKSTISGQLIGAKFDFVSMVDCDLSKVDSAGSNFYYSNFAYMQSNNGKWYDTDFHSSWMRKSDFSDSTIEKCGFLGSDMSNVCFSNAILENRVRFSFCNMPFADFSASQLLDSIEFSYSNLCGANFTNTHNRNKKLHRFKGSVVIGLEGLDLNNPCFNDAIKTPEELVSAMHKMLSGNFNKDDKMVKYTYHQSLLYVIEQEKNPEKKEYYQKLSEAFIQKFQETALFSTYDIEKQNDNFNSNRTVMEILTLNAKDKTSSNVSVNQLSSKGIIKNFASIVSGIPLEDKRMGGIGYCHNKFIQDAVVEDEAYYILIDGNTMLESRLSTKTEEKTEEKHDKKNLLKKLKSSKVKNFQVTKKAELTQAVNELKEEKNRYFLGIFQYKKQVEYVEFCLHPEGHYTETTIYESKIKEKYPELLMSDKNYGLKKLVERNNQKYCYDIEQECLKDQEGRNIYFSTLGCKTYVKKDQDQKKEITK